MSWRRLCSRAGVPSAPRKYLVVTMVDALTLQKSGNSTPFCSKTTSPVFQLVCTTSRRSQVTSSYGCTSAVKTCLMLSPASLSGALWFPGALWFSGALFSSALLFSDRPFAERVVSVISAFLVRLAPLLAPRNTGWPGFGCGQARSWQLRAAADDDWCARGPG